MIGLRVLRAADRSCAAAAEDKQQQNRRADRGTANCAVAEIHRYGINGVLALAADVHLLHGLASGISWFGNNANAFLELQWYMFTGMVLLGGPYTLKMNEDRARIWIDIIGGLLFLLPICIILIYFTWPVE